jgi:PKD repeat protein
MRRVVLWTLIFLLIASLGGCGSGEAAGPGDPANSGNGGQNGGSGGLPGAGSSSMDPDEEKPGSLIARIIAPETVMAGEPASFDGSTSTGATVFTWSFGDGKRAGVARAPHIFTTAGTYEVTLVVRNGAGARAEATHTIEVTAGPAAEGESEIAVDVRDRLGAVLPGATVKTPLGEQTTDDKGRATVLVPRGPATMLWVSHPNFASHARRVRVGADLDEGGYRVVMIERAPSQTVEDIEAGAVVNGGDGARLTLPENALVDLAGKRVTGAVEVSITPLDTPSTPFAFPSEVEAVDENESRVALASFGVVEIEISQNGERLDLAEGARATLDIPIYADQSATGAPLELGDSIPLWSLDESTGVWIQEGEGTVVEGPSRAGLALRSSLGHLSWWNCDEPFPIRKLLVNCCADTDGDGECNAATACALEGRLSCGPSACSGAESPVTAIVSPGGAELLVPAELPFRLDAYGFAEGMQPASVDGVNGVGPLTIVLPYDVPGPTPPPEIAPGYDATHELVLVGEVDTFVVDTTGPSWIVVNGPLVGRAKVAPQPLQEFGGSTTASFFVTAGRHTLTVSSSTVGEYRLRVLSNESFIPNSLSPAHGSTTLSGISPLLMSFTAALNPTSVAGINPMTVNMGVTTTNAASGANLTLTPTADWPAGRQLRVSSALARTAGGVQSPADMSFRFQVASHAGGPWELYPCPAPYGECVSLIDYVTNEAGDRILVFGRRRASSDRGLYAAAYVGGQWRDPVELSYDYGSIVTPSVAMNASGDGMILWADYASPSDSSPSIVRRVRLSGGTIGTTFEDLSTGAAIRTGDSLAAAIDELGNEAVLWVTSTHARTRTRTAGGAWSAPRDLFSLNVGAAHASIAGQAGRFVFAVQRGVLRAAYYDPSVVTWLDGWGPSITAASTSAGLPRIAINQDGYAYVTTAGATNTPPPVLGFDYQGNKSWQEFSSLAAGETDTQFDGGCTAAGVVMPDTGYAGYLQACSRGPGEPASENRVWVKPLAAAVTMAPVYTAPPATVQSVHRGSYRLLRSSDGTLHSFRWDDTTKQVLYRSSANGFAGPDRVVYQSATGAVPSDIQVAVTAEQEPSAGFRLGSAAIAISVP